MTTAKSAGFPVSTADPFSLENLANPHPLHEQLREAGPVVRLEHYGIWGMARYEQVNAALKNWVTFSSGSGSGLSDFRKEKPWRVPSLLLEADPPAHTRAREVVGPILAPPALKPLQEGFENEAETLLKALVRRVERIEITDQPQRKPNNTMRAWSSLPVTVYPTSLIPPQEGD